MNLQERKELLIELGQYMLSDDDFWKFSKAKATSENPWFTPDFIELAINNIVQNYLQPDALERLINKYDFSHVVQPKKIGIVMAGNIPLVGFHDMLAVFITGHHAYIKPSSKDEALIVALIKKLHKIDERAADYFSPQLRLKDCDAYITTGSNNTASHFAYYFKDYPHIIRKNRTSVAVLTGKESIEELEKLADDVYQYFGLGCRNVTKIYVPEQYNFENLLSVFSKYNYLNNHTRYRNNYDYNLALHIINNSYYMTNESITLVEGESPFSPISLLHYSYYNDGDTLMADLKKNENIQCIVGEKGVAFGEAQCPDICTYADGIDTIQFLLNLQLDKEVRKS